MNGVSAVRAYTLIAMLAIVAGGWMLNEAPEVDLMEEEMDNFAEMEKQALKINSWGKNIYVKIPVINSKGKFTGQLIRPEIFFFLASSEANLKHLSMYLDLSLESTLKGFLNFNGIS